MLEAFVDAALDTLRAGEPLAPASLTVLLRVYASTGRDDVGEAIGAALGRATGMAPAELAPDSRADWLRLYVEAAQLSEDRRLGDAATAIASELEAACAPHVPTSFAERAGAVQAVLAATPVVDARRFAPAAIDELERLVASAYAPGEGLRGRTPDESVAVAHALLAAFDVTGRLAYPMLAEELMRAVRRDLSGVPVSSCCDAARVFNRLARLHADDGYRATAVLADDADYARDASELLRRAAGVCATPRDAAAYALALTEQPDGS